MGKHDQYGKTVLQNAFGKDFDKCPAEERLTYCGEKAGSINIDGILYDEIAVEVESRVSKQVRGAVMDLILHPLEKKLLILIKAHINGYTAAQARHIFDQFLPGGMWEVVTIKGCGNRPTEDLEKDMQTVSEAVDKLKTK